MKQTAILFVLTLVLVLAGCTPAPNPEQLIAAAKELDRKWLEAFNAQDADAMMALYLNSPDLVSYPVEGGLCSRGGT